MMEDITIRYTLTNPKTKEFVKTDVKLSDIEHCGSDAIYNETEDKYNPCTCNCDNSCECSSVFDNHKITNREVLR